MCVLVCTSLCTLQSNKCFCAGEGKKNKKKIMIVTVNNSCSDSVTPPN